MVRLSLLSLVFENINVFKNSVLQIIKHSWLCEYANANLVQGESMGMGTISYVLDIAN